MDISEKKESKYFIKKTVTVKPLLLNTPPLRTAIGSKSERISQFSSVKIDHSM
jgi:hypothetical protein